MSKTVLITGAGTGIGLSCVKKFLNSGWNICAHYNQTAHELKEIEKKSGKQKLKLIQVDFSKINQAQKFLDGIGKLKLDALVNNAGVYDLSEGKSDRMKGIQDVFCVNIIVPTLIAQKVLQEMKNQGRGAIVNVSSIGVKYGSSLKNIFYSASKAGLEATTKTLAREGAPFNILVNAIRPGVTDTLFHKKLGKNLDQRKQLIPLKRLGQPDEIANFIYFLCAENTFITGETLAIAGGE